jgi:N-acetylglucosamine-6-sulfatase
MPRRLLPTCLLVASGVLGVGLLAAGPGGRAAGAPPTPPNVIVLLTDDQTVGEMGAVPNVRREIADEGATFTRAYVSFPLCCPSRASILTGLYMHNHGVRGNGGIYGGWKRFVPDEPVALPVRLKDAGYHTALIGKYLNGYSAADGLYVPPGWDEWYGRIGGEVKVYYDYNLVEQGPAGVPATVHYGADEADYSTDVFGAKALDFVERAGSLGQPFYLELSYSAPHYPFTPAARDIYRKQYRPIPHPPGYNERDVSDKPRWLRRDAPKRFGPGEAAKLDDQERRRRETLLAVDDSVNALIHALDQDGLLENTYLIFTSDNGLFRGEHRLTGGKYLPYEPASHVPLLIRGPGIAPGTFSDELVDNVDIAETILQVAGIGDPSLDGRSLLPYAEDPTLRTTRPILLEGDTGPGRGNGGDEGEPSAARRATSKTGLARLSGVKNLDMEKGRARPLATGDRAPPYRAIRTDRYLYVLYGTGDSELYDMDRDPAQLHSLDRDPRYAPVREWLFAHLLDLIRCRGEACRAEIGDPPAPLPRRADRRR